MRRISNLAHLRICRLAKKPTGQLKYIIKKKKKFGIFVKLAILF